MKKRYTLALIALFSISTFNVNASHYMGGEITWECLTTGTNAGKYIFTMKVYRECHGINFGSSQTLSSTSPAGSIAMSLVTGWPKDISPNCNVAGPTITCAGAIANNTGAVEEFVYRSQPVQINGVPPTTGWKFYWFSCCRNPSANVPNATSKGWQLRAKMYPYNNLNAYPCYDDSPVFAEESRSVLTVGYPFTYNHNAYDKQLDSLSFEWGQPLGGASPPYNTPLAFGPGYAYNSPLPGTAQNPNNVPATVNLYTGDISFTSYTTGAFVTSTKVTAFRCGIKIAEIWREMQIVLLNAGTNNPPNISIPFNYGTSFDTVVLAGDLVNVAISGADLQYLPNGSQQTVYLSHFSSQFGAYVPATGSAMPTLSTTAGCQTPPCATLTPASGPNNEVSGTQGLTTSFSWQTTCDHLLPPGSCCGQPKDTVFYDFVISMRDDFCPAPASQTKRIRIGVRSNIYALLPPEIDSAYFDYQAFAAHIFWKPIIDTLNTFKAYYIYYSPDNGNYTLLDSTLNINDTSYTHIKGDTTRGYYKLKTVSQNLCGSIKLSNYSNVFDFNILGVDIKANTNDFVLYPTKPNPASRFTILPFYTKEPSEVKIIVNDVSGHIVKQAVFMSAQGDNSYKLSLDHFNAGVYYITVYYKKQKKLSKLIVK
jgi:hypothetical protein